LKKIIDILIKARFTFFKPKNKKIVILDPEVSKPIEDLFFRLDYFYLYSRNEEINLFVLLKALINYKKNKNLSFNQVYILTYLNYLEPKIIINVTDHNIFFLNLKKYFPEAKLILIQQAWFAVDTFQKILKNKRKFSMSKFKVDYACLYGRNTSLFYSKFMKTKYLVTGSVKNNNFSIKKSNDKSIVFISQFRMHINYNFKKNTFNNISDENLFYRHLNKYCKKYNKRLFVLSCHTEQKLEEEYFNRNLGTDNFVFISKSNWKDTYINSEDFNYFVTSSSTLGYELMAKGKRVAFVFLKKFFNWKFENIKSSFFAIKDEGFFWTKSEVYEKFEKILNNAFFCSVLRHRLNIKKYINPYMVYDKGNKKFINFITRLNNREL